MSALDHITTLLEQLNDRVSKLNPQYELLSDADAMARFKLTAKKVSELRNSPNGPRAAVDGKDSRVSLSEWIAFFQREEKRKGVRQ